MISAPYGALRAARGRLALAVAATFATLLLVEGALRVAGYGDGRPGEYELKDGLPSGHPGRAPGPRDDTLTFRDMSVLTPKPPGAYRIATLGDSFTYGVGVLAEEAFPAQLERVLRRRGYRVEVANLGRAGANAHQYAIVARRFLHVVEPDVVLTTVVGGDECALPWNPSPAEGCGVTLTPAEARGHWLLRHVYAYRPLHPLLANDGCVGPRRCVSHDGIDPEALMFRCYRRSLHEALAIARERGAGVVLTYMPDLRGELELPPAERNPVDKALAVLHGAGLPALDLRPAFAGHRGAELHLPDDSHPNPLGHRLLAEHLASELERRWGDGTLPLAPRGELP